MRHEPAIVVRLSAQTTAVVARRAVTLVRGREAFTLAEPEERALRAAFDLPVLSGAQLAEEDGQPGMDGRTDPEGRRPNPTGTHARSKTRGLVARGTGEDSAE